MYHLRGIATEENLSPAFRFFRKHRHFLTHSVDERPPSPAHATLLECKNGTDARENHTNP